MIDSIFILLFTLITVFCFIKIQTGFTLIVAMQMAVPTNVRLNLGFIDLQFLNTLTLVLLCAFAYHLIRGKIKRPPFTGTFVKPFIITVSVLFFLVFFSTTIDLFYHFKTLYFYVYNYFVPCTIAFFVYDNKKEIERFIKIVSIITIIITSYGIYCYITLTNPYIAAMILKYPGMDALVYLGETRGGLNGRIQGTLLHPLIWGGLCLLLLFFLQNIKNKFLRIILAVTLFLNIFFSGSRSAIMALLVGIIYLFIQNGMKLKLKSVFTTLIISIVAIITIYNVPAFKKYTTFLEAVVFFWDDESAKNADFGGSTYDMRLNQVEGTFELLDGSFLTGLGQGYTNYYTEKYGVHPVLFGFESIYFLALVNTGLIGLFIWHFLFYKLFRNVTFIQNTGPPKKVQSYFLLKVFVLVYFVFIALTGFQNVLTIFLIFYAIQFKQLSIE
jgi:hypothetical protein